MDVNHDEEGLFWELVAGLVCSLFFSFLFFSFFFAFFFFAFALGIDNISSQAMDVGTLKSLPADTIRILVWILSFLSFGFATAEFEVTSDRLGVYRPEEHIEYVFCIYIRGGNG